MAHQALVLPRFTLAPSLFAHLPVITGVSLYKHQDFHPTAAFLLTHAMRHDSDLGIVTPEATALAEHVTMVSWFP
jgi:hypothetical protein